MQESFDYIVVGAGSAGCVVAARLSENGKYTVLLLEAGPEDSNPWIHIPMGFGKTFFNKKINWCFNTQAMPSLNGRSLYTPAGKVLGGSSSINGLVYARGQHQDFDGWYQAGNEGWSYADVLPFFRKSENQQRGSDSYHGINGPLDVSDVMDRHPLSVAFVESAQAAGYGVNHDFNGSSQEGVGPFQVTARGGKRKSCAVGFLHEAKRRKNLCIQTCATVHKLNIQGTRVVGVDYLTPQGRLTACAKRRVILSAGAINSPAILQRSGIGRREWLDEAGIALKHELDGVGANLQDHPQARIVLRSRRVSTLNTQIRNPYYLAKMGLQYALFNRGPLASSGGQTGGFLKSRPDLDRPDLMYFCMPFSSMDLRKGLDAFPGITLASVLLRPESRGSVRVRSAHLDDAPLIQPNYLSNTNDQDALLAGLRIARLISSSGPLREEIIAEERPGAALTTDAELLNYIRTTATSGFHHCGTCKMGTGKDAVVDARLRLHGLDGLMVADASIMPTIVSSGTHPAAVMIGERAASFILEEG
jgi:choline dehydrogenase